MERVWFQDFTRANQRYGNDWHPGKNCQIERSALEGKHFTGATAAAFGKHHHGTALLDPFGGLVESLQRLAWAATVNRNVPGTAQVPSEKRYAEEPSLGQKAELYRQADEQDRNIHGARMIGAEDDGLIGIDILDAFYIELYSAGLKDQPRPCPSAPVLPAAAGVKE